MPSTLALIIPLYNESGNIERLQSEIINNFEANEVQVLLINNGSTDSTANKIRDAVKKDQSLFKFLNLDRNHGYGGGVRHGFQGIKSDWVCWIPGDLQVKPAEVNHIWKYIKEHNCRNTIVKGLRTSREDSLTNFIVSKIYTWFGNILLGLRIKDLNALPKFFPSDFIRSLPDKMESSFVFDAEMLYLAKLSGLGVIELPVGWYKRHSGLSSWSGRKFKVYWQTFLCLEAIRRKY